jgi:hypothetical protein
VSFFSNSGSGSAGDPVDPAERVKVEVEAEEAEKGTQIVGTSESDQ